MYKSQFSDKKYVFCVCVDNLRPDRLGVNGNRIGHSDTIDRLLAEGINCVNCYSNSNPTQFSYPVIFSSTYALDYGGYSKGVMERPITLPEIFSNNSYATFGFSTSCFLENMSGYARGFDEFFILFDVAEHVWNRFVNVDLKYYHDLFSRNKITKELYLQKANELCVETFERMGSYFDDLLIKSEVYEKNYKKYDFLSANVAYLRELVDAEIVRMEEVGGRYFDQIHCYKNFYQFVSSVWGVELPFSIKVLLFLSGVSQKRIFSNKFVKLLFQVKNIRFVSADKIVKHVSDIVNAKKGKNLFFWMHLLDVHDEVYSENALQTPLSRWRVMFEKVKSLWTGQGINDLSVAYDLSINSVDESLSALMKMISDNGLMDDSVIILYSDHGTNQGPPYRSRPCPGNFFEELTHVPMLFWGKGSKGKEVDCHTSLADMIPTIHELFGFKSNHEYVGLSVVNKEIQERDYLIFEHNARGPNDLKYKPIVVCVRKGEYKLIYKEYSFESYTNDLSENEFYDLGKDSDEQHNIYEVCGEHSEALMEMLLIAEERVEKIRQEYQNNYCTEVS